MTTSRDELKDLITEAISEAVKNGKLQIEVHHCAAQGLNSEQVAILQRLIRTIDGTAIAIGRTLVVSIVMGLIALLVAGFWDQIRRGGP